MDFLKRLKVRKPAPLRCAPAVRRQKNYSAGSGYAYEYFYEGLRDLNEGREHVFTVSGDRKNWFEVQVIVEDNAIRDWEKSNQRVLSESERYAVAKMALFEAFDMRESPVEMRPEVRVDARQVDDLLKRLGVAE